jgi:hypothetical protein
MKYQHGVVVATSFILAEHMVSAGPIDKRGVLDPLFEISTLGGIAFKIHQVPNQKFYGARKGRGAMALAKAYSKYGVAVPDDLISYIEQILEELGLGQNPGGGNNTSTSPQGEKL